MVSAYGLLMLVISLLAEVCGWRLVSTLVHYSPGLDLESGVGIKC